jgi:hypothetical protein
MPGFRVGGPSGIRFLPKMTATGRGSLPQLAEAAKRPKIIIYASTVSSQITSMRMEWPGSPNYRYWVFDLPTRRAPDKGWKVRLDQIWLAAPS